MSSKIDGVPRELLEKIRAMLWYRDIDTDEQLSALLAAPVVERQPVAWLIQCQHSGLVEQAEPNDKSDHPEEWSDSFPVYTAPPELVELQATIARLTADVETMRAKNNELNDTVERLTAGQGEPVARLCDGFSLNGKPYRWVTLLNPEEQKRENPQFVPVLLATKPLFASQPVSDDRQQLIELLRRATSRHGGHRQGQGAE